MHKEQEELNQSYTYTSARTLLGVLRLSQALARLRFADAVELPDVDEALRLMEASKESLQEDSDRDRERDQSVVSKIYRMIKEMASRGGGYKSQGRRKEPQKLGRRPGGQPSFRSDSDDDDDDSEIAMSNIRATVLARGFTEDDLMNTIQEVGFQFFQLQIFKLMGSQYERLDVWVRVAHGARLRMLDSA